MCFSATASFSACTVLFGIGVLCVKQVRDRSQLAFASIPLLFAIQQLSEGVIWMTFDWNAPGLRVLATQVYSVFSHVLWPIYVPIAAWAMERVAWRRRCLGALSLAGVASAVFLAYGMVAAPVKAVLIGGHIDYASAHFYLPVSLTLYLAATTLGMAISSHRMVQLFGLTAFVAAGLTHLAYAQWFLSVWCFCAAVLSVLVYLHVRAEAGRAVPGSVGTVHAEPVA